MVANFTNEIIRYSYIICMTQALANNCQSYVFITNAILHSMYNNIECEIRMLSAVIRLLHIGTCQIYFFVLVCFTVYLILVYYLIIFRKIHTRASNAYMLKKFIILSRYS